MLVIFLVGTSRWIPSFSSAYLDQAGSELIVAQRGIDDFLFAQSAFPEATTVRSMPMSRPT